MSVVLDGVVFGESPRWHDGRLWFSDWGAGEVISLPGGGGRTVEARVQSFPMCIDFLPDGRLLVVSAADRALLRREADGTLVTHADLAAKCNDIVVDGRGNAYVNCVNFDFPGGEFQPGFVLLVTPDGQAARVADGLAFPNGMAVTSDTRTLIVAESYAQHLTAYDIGGDGQLSGRRVWAHPPATTPTASASTRTARSGTPMSATNTACGSGRAARCWRSSNSTAAHSRARSAAATTRPSTSWASTGAAPTPSAAPPARS